MRRTFPALIFVLTGCLSTSVPAPTPAHLVSLTVDPQPVSPDRIARLPTFTFTFDRAVSGADDSTVWLVSGAPTDALRSDAMRASTNPSTVSDRIAARVAFDLRNPTQFTLMPRAPLAPDVLVTVVTSARLLTPDGAPVGTGGIVVAPLVAPFRVAPIAQCPALAHLAFPLATDVPLALSHVRIRFDRPLHALDDGPLATLIDDAHGTAVDTDAVFACVEATGARCLDVSPHDLLAPLALHRLALGNLADDSGLEPQALDLAFTTGTDETAPLPTLETALACADDETAHGPFCTRALARGLVLRAETTFPGSLRLGGIESVAGLHHELTVAWRAIDAWNVEVLALDGRTGASVVLDALVPPADSPAVRITEVLARPFSGSAQEFVEIVNDGTAEVSLAAMRLRTRTGASVLPDVTLAGGARAVIVGPTFDPRAAPDRGDPAVAPGTTVVRLEHAIASHGLADHGGDLWLDDANGLALSHVPTSDPTLLPRLGTSVVRADVRIDEDDPIAWSYDADGSATPGRADRLR